ncbi:MULTISPECIES: flagellar hook-length control protein FliK [Clostridia]|uniref:flagellar hook-length control protein FliK n=1 Tax=Clostridia TaxID=186801 RepID=UPI000E9FFEB7|nr:MULTISPECIES: flagellar hook-length control protein FliK [Clostridia]NBJ68400.1 hypothetical protein [Roseburia sp. 1XD42-34]RKI81488.1 hypothetical protein D7V87_02770 [Clostridium sp. 1xD42-85]
MNAVGILLQQLPTALGKNEMKQMETNQELSAQSFHELLSYKEEVVKVMEQLKQLEEVPFDSQALHHALQSVDIPLAFKQWMIGMGAEPLALQPMLKEEWTVLGANQPQSEIQPTENGQKPSSDKQAANNSIQQQMVAVFSKVEPILAQIKDQQDIKQATTKLADFLYTWSELSKQAKSIGLSEDIAARLSDNKNVKEVAIWKQLVAAFEKRSAFVQKQHYNSEAKVTSGDVAKWLTKAIESISEPKQTVFHSKEQITTNNSMNHQLSVPMAKLEQHVIYLQPEQSTPRQNGQELMQQLQRIMNSSKFMKLPNGANQLNLTLRPQHLGDISVRLTQLDGVMTVRILVQSQAAKEMLESNIHKLRNMFSPQQVVIEKQEGILQQGQQTQRGNGAESQQYPNQQEQQQQQSEHENTDNDAEFTTSFQEVLLNEQV